MQGQRDCEYNQPFGDTYIYAILLSSTRQFLASSEVSILNLELNRCLVTLF